MKKILSFLIAVMFAGSMMASVGNVHYTLQFTKVSSNSAYAKSYTFESNGLKWTVPGNMSSGNYDRIGGSNITAAERVVASQAAIDDGIAQIVITHNGGSRAAMILDSIALTVASDADFTKDVVVEEYAMHLGDGKAKIAAGEITLTPTADLWPKDSYYKVTFFITNTTGSNGGIDVVSLAFYSYQDASAPAINASKVDFGLAATTSFPIAKTEELVVTGANLSQAISYTIIGTHVTATGTLTADGGSLNVKLTADEDAVISDTIVLTSGAVELKVPVEADVRQTVGAGTKEKPFTVADVVKLNNEIGLDKYWVVGYIVGCAANKGELATSTTESNIAIGDAADQTKGVVPVELPSGNVRTALNISTTPGNVGKQVKVYGQLISYFSFTGVKTVSDFELIEPAAPTLDNGFYLVGTMNNWTAAAAYKFEENPTNAGEYQYATTLAAGDEFKVIEVKGDATTWYPAESGNYVVNADHAGEVTVYFRADGQGGSDWYENCIYVYVPQAPADPTNCAEAAAAALSVSENKEEYNNGAVYAIQGYVTEIAYPYDAEKGNMSFWMADTKDGGKVLEAYKCVVASADEAPEVGDLVKVTGKLTKYNTTPEFAEGCTFVLVQAAPLADGYYLLGTMNGWKPTKGYLLSLNQGNTAEYFLETTLAENDEFKIGNSVNGAVANDAWYPGGSTANYKVDALHAGEKTVFFRPDGQGASDWHEGYIYVAKTPENLGVKTIAEFLNLKNYIDTCVLTGVVANIVKDDAGAYSVYGNFDLVDANDPTVSVFIYGLLNAAGEAKKFLEMGIDEKDTLTLKAVYNEYNGKPEALNAVFVSVKKYVEPVTPPTPSEWDEIVFTAVTSASELPEDSLFTLANSEFSMKISDTGDKMSIDGNNCLFGEGLTKYEYRLKTGGSSGSSNFMTLNVPADGNIRLAVRTGSNSATDRALVIKQGNEELYNKVVQETDKVGEGDEAYYPYITVAVKKGTVTLTYTGGLNFYALAFKEVAAPALENGYYLVGTMNNWGVDAAFKFEENDKTTNEYVLKGVELATTDQFKVVYSADGTALTKWYPDGMDNNYGQNGEIVADGTYDIYFRPDANGNDDWFYKVIYAAKVETPEPPTPVVYDTIYVWDGSNNKEAAIVKGGEASVVGATSNVIGKNEKGNWSLVLGKGFSKGENYILISLSQAIKKGDKIVLAMHRSAKEGATAATATFGADFNASNEEMTTNGQVLIVDPETLTANGLPNETIFVVPDAADGAKYVRLYRNAGSTSIYVPKFVILREHQDTPEPPTSDIYTVAGSESVFGVNWAPDAVANEMTLTGTDTYVWEKAGLELQKGDVEFKVVKGHAWGEQYPSDNYKLPVTEAGIYTLTITFNATSKEIGTNLVKTGDLAEELPVIAIAGSMNGWNSKKDIFVAAADELTASLTLTLEAGRDTFKIVSGANWLGEYGNEGLYQMHRDWTVAKLSKVGKTDDNIELIADVAGEYTFTWTYADSTLAITFPEKGPEPKFYIAGSMTDWATNKIPVYEDSYTFSNLELLQIYQLKVIDGNDWKGFDDLTNKSGLIGDIDGNICFALTVDMSNPLKREVTVTYTGQVFTVTGNIYPVPTIADGYYWCGTDLNWFATQLMKSGSLNDYLFAPNQSPDGKEEYKLTATLTSGDQMKVVKVEGNALKQYYPSRDDNFVIDADHAGQKDIYFRPQGNTEWTEFNGFLWIEASQGTGLDNNADDVKAVKIMRDGQFYILKGGKIFSITGQLVK